MKDGVAMEENKEVNLDLVQFQYDGDLTSDVKILGEYLSYHNYETTTWTDLWLRLLFLFNLSQRDWLVILSSMLISYILDNIQDYR